MERFVVEEKFTTALARSGITNCRSAWQYFGEPQGDRRREVVIVHQPLRTGESVFYKIYDYVVSSWRYFGRHSKARCEYNNYAVFRHLDIPCAARVAWGEERDALGRLRRAFIITAAIPGAVPLPQFIASRNPGRRDRREILRQLADIAHRLHLESFFHNDFVVRNILVTDEPKLWLIDCPRGSYTAFNKRHHLIKDIASLDKGASLLATRAERLAFAKLYLHKSRLNAEVKQLVRDTLVYRKERWPK